MDEAKTTDGHGMSTTTHWPRHVNCGLPKMAQGVATRLQYHSCHRPANTSCASCVLLYHHLALAPCVPSYDHLTCACSARIIDLPLQSLHCLIAQKGSKHNMCQTPSRLDVGTSLHTSDTS